MATFGNDCISRPNTFAPGDGSCSVFDATNPVIEYGTLTQVCIYVQGDLGGATLKVKVFRPNGANIEFVGESSPQVAVAGANTFSGLSIAIQSGDYIGWYQSGFGADVAVTTSGGSVYDLDGDISATTALSSWNGNGYVVSVLATYTPSLSDVYVNSSTGNDTYAGDSCVAGHPVLTFGRALSILNLGGTIHVCNSGADFSGETVTLNKSFSIDLNGASGYFYMPKAS